MYRYIFYVLFVFILVSCERTVDVDLPVQESKLVVYSLFTPDSTVNAALTSSIGILEDSELNFVTEATVDIYEEDAFLETLTKKDFSFLQWGWAEQIEIMGTLFQSENTIEADKSYRLEVEAEGFESVKATTTVPEVVAIEEVSSSNLFVDFGTENGNNNVSFTVKFTDPVGENYYEIKAYSYNIYEEYEYVLDSTLNEYVQGDLISIDTFRQKVYMEYNDFFSLNALNSGQSIFINDDLFEGNTTNIKISIYDIIDENGQLLVELVSHSKESYLYLSSKRQQDWSREDFFSEPVFVYSNVENGYGVFGAYRSSFFVHTP